MVDYKKAFSTEEKLMFIFKQSKDLDKYKLELHQTDQYGIDIVATAAGYEEFAIELESTQGDKWPPEAPYPVSWKNGFSVPARKKKFFDTHPLSLFVKVNSSITRASVIPMAFIFSAGDPIEYDNENGKHFKCNDFYTIPNANHPALAFCKIDVLPSVVDGQFQFLKQMKRLNAKHTDLRPNFRVNLKKEK